MKLRFLPGLLLLGILTFCLTQSDPVQAHPSQIEASTNQSTVTPALSTATPAVTTPTLTATAPARTPPVSANPVQTAPASATTLIAAEKIERSASSVGPAFEKFLEEGGAVAPTPDDLEAAEAGMVENISQPVVAEQTQVESDYGKFDLSRLRLANLLPATAHSASLDGQTGTTTVSVSSQLKLGSSGVIPDEAAKTLAAEKDAPQLWPVKGKITSTFGPRQALVMPTATDNATGKGGSGPATAPASGLTVTLPASTPTPTAPASATTTASTLPPTPTPTPTKAVPIAATAPVTPTQPEPSTQATPTPGAATAVTPTVTAEAAFTPLPVTTTPTTSTTPDLTPTPTAIPTITATPTISATATVSPTVTPTATPWPTGPIPTINGFLPGVGAGEEYHTGLDIAVPEGTQVRATADGVVVYAGNGGGYGRVVFIQHAGGFMTVYGHNSKLLVEAGQTVKAGQVISLSGSTGYSTGPHVHYEIRYNGKIADPAYFLGLKK